MEVICTKNHIKLDMREKIPYIVQMYRDRAHVFFRCMRLAENTMHQSLKTEKQLSNPANTHKIQDKNEIKMDFCKNDIAKTQNA